MTSILLILTGVGLYWCVERLVDRYLGRRPAEAQTTLPDELRRVAADLDAKAHQAAAASADAHAAGLIDAVVMLRERAARLEEV